MAKQLAFFVDIAGCTGCKACQIACKDKNGLGKGILWRRVYEVAGGGWEKSGDSWISTVFAYSVSMACNHCEKPICAEICPTLAITKGENGVVMLDPGKCIGCQYCRWSCPYGAPQYDHEKGAMTKCTFCSDLVEVGQQPACVAACPMRALDFGERSDIERRYGSQGPIHPLPAHELTEPAIRIAKLLKVSSPDAARAKIANREEVGTE